MEGSWCICFFLCSWLHWSSSLRLASDSSAPEPGMGMGPVSTARYGIEILLETDLELRLESGFSRLLVPALEVLHAAFEVVEGQLRVAADQTLQHGIVQEHVLLLISK